MQQQASDTAATVAAKVAPPVGVVTANIAGVTVPDIIQWLTLVYVILMVLHKTWHMFKEYQTGKQYPVREEDELL